MVARPARAAAARAGDPVPARARCCCWSASRGPQAKLSQVREGATVVLAMDVSRLDGREGHPADAARARPAPRRPVRSRASEQVPDRARSRSPTTRRSACRRPTLHDEIARRIPPRRPSPGRRSATASTRRSRSRARRSGRTSRARRIRRSRSSCSPTAPRTRASATPPGGRRRRARPGIPVSTVVARHARRDRHARRSGREHRAGPGPRRPARPAGDRDGDRRHVLRSGDRRST